MTGTTTKCGYLSVNPTRSYRERIHRIVAKLFITNPENKEYVNHINFDRTDNRLQNLEWCTPSENTQHSQNNKRLGRMQLTIKNQKTGQIYESAVIAHRCNNINISIKQFTHRIKKDGEYGDLIYIGKLYKKRLKAQEYLKKIHWQNILSI